MSSSPLGSNVIEVTRNDTGQLLYLVFDPTGLIHQVCESPEEVKKEQECLRHFDEWYSKHGN